MSKKTRQLVEHISDQYVLLAADSAQAFAAAAQKKKKNRAKIFAIAAAAAAMYIIITVSLIIGAITPPDDPVAPPDGGPGAQGQPEQPGGPGTGPEQPGGPDAGPEDPGGPDAGPEEPGGPDAGPEEPGGPDVGPEDPNPPDDPITPPTPPEPEITLPDEPYLDEIRCANEVYGTWTDGDWLAGEVKDIVYHFTPGGYFYQMNMKTWESVTGVYYYYADGTILLFEADEEGNPVRQMPCYGIRNGDNRGVITMHSLEDDTTLGTYTLGSTYPSSELLHVRTKTHSYFIPYMFPEAFIWDADSRFEFDTSFFLDKIQTMPHIAITEAPSFYISLVGQSVTYTLYVKEDGEESMEIISEGMLLDQGAKLVLPDLPESYWEEPDVCYYLDIRYETGGYNAYCNKQFMHYFVALKCVSDEEESYTPPEATEDSVLIENCDTQPQGAFELDTASPTEGEGCWSITTPAAGALGFHAWENGIDAGGCDVIEFDLYISDLAALEALKKNCALELSSSGTCDVQEIAFSGEQIVEFGRYGQEWQVGWNHVVLRIADATATNGKGNVPFDISNVNFVRFYLLTATDSHTIMIDNICLSVEQK